MIRVNPRERKILFGGIGCTLALSVYLFVISPYYTAINALDRRISAKSKELAEILTMRGEYLRLKENTRGLENVMRSARGFPLLSFLENLAATNQLKTKIADMKPVTTPLNERFKETSVEMKLEDVTLKQLIDYLYQIEQAPQPLQIKRIHITKKKDQTYLTVTLQVSTFEIIEGEPGKGPGKGPVATGRNQAAGS
jgi:type II secretory pathway component PulM